MRALDFPRDADDAAGFRALKVALRHHALAQTEPDADALADFNTATREGRDLSHYRELLDVAVRAVNGKAQESAVASLFSAGASTYGDDAQASGLAAVDLVAWMVLVP